MLKDDIRPAAQGSATRLDRSARLRAPTKIPDHLTEILIENATDSGRDIRHGRRQRYDGWTPERIRAFLRELSRTGSATEASRTAGISRKSAYALRNSAKGAAFARAWEVAMAFAMRRVKREPLSWEWEPFAEPIIRNGRMAGMRHDNRRLMAAITRLDRQTGAHGAGR